MFEIGIELGLFFVFAEILFFAMSRKNQSFVSSILIQMLSFLTSLLLVGSLKFVYLIGIYLIPHIQDYTEVFYGFVGVIVVLIISLILLYVNHKLLALKKV